jgi:hypothetical protein
VNNYYIYRVHITDSTYVRVEKKAPDGHELGNPQGKLGFSKAINDQLRHLQSALIDEAIASDSSAASVRAMGELLFSILFDERLTADFLSFFHAVKSDSQGAKLRLEISVDDAVLPEIAALPWEFLSVPINLRRGVLWLSTMPDIILSRRRNYWDLPTSVELRDGEKLRIGMIVAAPTDLEVVQYEHIWKQLQAIVLGWESVELLPLVEYGSRQTLDNLLELKPHIVHFIGHGRFNDGHPEIAFVDNIRRAANWCRSEEFAGIFTRHADCLVILQSCETAMLSGEKPFVGVASNLLDQGVPVVVAMQYEVSNVTAQTFAETFYRRLFDGEPVDIAVQEGRREIAKKKEHSTRDFATPVLYMRSPRMFSLPKETAATSSPFDTPANSALPRVFLTLIEEKTANFVGRQYVFDEINHFLQENDKGYFVIEADPGAGKSAILSKFVKDTNAIAHFNIRGQSINKAHQFLETISQQVIKRYHLPYPALPPEATRDGAFLSQILAEASEKLKADEQLVIGVDALDEVDVTGHIGNILYLPSSLPNGVFFILTSRRSHYTLVTAVPMQILDLDDQKYKQDIERDITQYILDATRRYDLADWIKKQNISLNEFISEMAGKSEKNFIYLTLVLGDIERGRYASLNIDQLPVGLKNYYETHWEIMGMRPLNSEDTPRKKLRVIYVICELREPLSRQLITAFAQQDGMEIDQLTVQSIIDEWEQFMHEEEIEAIKRYSLYHTSFRDFLHRKDIVQASGETLEGINGLIADNLWQSLFGSADIPSEDDGVEPR